MSLGSETTRQDLQDLLDTLHKTVGEERAPGLKPILLSNLDRGRVVRFVDDNKASLADYVRLVAATFDRLQPYLHQLQVERDSDAWEPLFGRMQTWAYTFFLGHGFAGEQNTIEIAVECASEASMTLLDAHFPYDTEFDAWAHNIVLNACRKFIEHGTKKSVVPDNMKVGLHDDLLGPDEQLLELGALDGETRAELERAIDQLPETRRFVIRSLYFDGLEPVEIAEKLGKSVGAVYSLQFRALRELRKILDGNRDNLNE